jgi:hypothetical protein
VRKLFVVFLLAVAAGSIPAAASDWYIPDEVNLEIQHISHVSQHFGSDSTDYGVEIASLAVRWTGHSWFLDIAEGAALNTCNDLHYYDSTQVLEQCGALEGPKEVFQATFGIHLWNRDYDEQP